MEAGGGATGRLGASLLERIDELNAHDLSRFVAFRVDAAQLGWVRRDRLPALGEYPRVFEVDEEGVALSGRLETAPARSRAMAQAARDLFARGLITDWRDEDYPVVALEDRGLEGEPVMVIERAAAPFIGVRTFGVHMTGFVREGGGLRMWLARRAETQREHPGKLDQLVAGGLTAGLGPVEVLVKEAGEEAGIDEVLARRARPGGLISYCVELPEGLSPATIFSFDLELPAGFVPRNRDGEVADFRLLPVEDVLGLVNESHAFKPNCGLVVIDFALRHGLIGADEPDTAQLVASLRR